MSWKIIIEVVAVKRQLFSIAVVGLLLLTGCQDKTVESPENSKLNTTNTVIEESSVPIATETPIEKRADADFRNAKWGDDIETVKKYEIEISLSESENQLAGETNIGGYDSYAGFLFDDNKLYEGLYAFPLNYSNAGQYIPVYDNLKDMLTQKYGEPYEDEIIPLTKQSQIDLAGPAHALEYGYVVYRSQWQTDETNIMLGMSAEDYEVGLVITYIDKNYEKDINDSGL